METKEKKILSEDSQFGQYLSGDEFGEYFVGPIMDVFKVAKIALKDIGRGVLYNVRIAFTFSTTKKARLLEAYKQGKEKINQEYAEVMQRVDKNLGEAKLLMFAANPPAFLAAAAVKQGLDAGAFVGKVFGEQSDALKGKGPDGDPTKPEDGPILGALNDLKRIFFGESYVVGKIMEAAEDGKGSADIEAEIVKEMESIDVDPESITSDFKEWVDSRREIISAVDEEGLPARMAALLDMMKADDLDKLKKSVGDAKSAGVDLGNYLGDFEKEFETQKKDLIDALKKEKEESDSGKKEPEILSKLKEVPEIKKLGEKASEEDYLKALENSLFMTLKANLQEDGEKILEEIKKEIGELVQIITGPFENETEINEFAKSSSEAAEIAKEMIRSYKQLTGK